MVSALLVGRGEDVEPGRPVLKIVRSTDLVVQATLENPSSPALTPGMAARVRLNAPGATDLTSAVDRVEQADGRRTVQFSVNWPSSLPAVGSEARIVVPMQTREGILLVPKSAIRTDGGHRLVDVVNGTTSTRVEVSTGLATETDVEILDGLQEGQRVRVGL